MGKRGLFFTVMLLSICIALAAPDIYEPDDSIAQSTMIPTNGSIQSHTYEPAGDEDFFNFSIMGSTEYLIETSNLGAGADTMLFLYDDDGTTEIASNDDIILGIIRNSRIKIESTKESFYYIKSKDWNASLSGGSYDISVTQRPIINSISCKDDSSWKSCFDMEYGSNLTEVRANCTYGPDVIESIEFLLYNEDDSSVYFNASNATMYAGGYFVYQGTAVLNHSGAHNISVTCTAADSASSAGSTAWDVSWGKIMAEIISPTEDILAAPGIPFNVTMMISCGSGQCQNINAFLDPEKNSKKRRVAVKMQPTVKGSVSVKGSAMIASSALDMNELEIAVSFEEHGLMFADLEQDQIEALRKDPKVISIVDERLMHVFLDVSVPLISADQAATSGYDGSGQTVCVIDTGVDYSHADLGGCFGAGCRVVAGYDYVNDDSDPMDDHGHGTHVAGIIASDDATYKGVAPASKIVAIKACDASGVCLESDIISAINWCRTNKDSYNISVISMSVGGEDLYDTYCTDDNFAPFIDSAAAEGIAVVVATGNDYSASGIASPSCVKSAIAVGASTDADEVASFSNREHIMDLFAPGRNIVSLAIGGGTTSKSGTSMATPHVSGVAALIYQFYQDQRNQTLEPYKIKQLLSAFGHDIYDAALLQSFPRINALSVLDEKGLIPTEPGHGPFYTTQENPFNSSHNPCLLTLDQGESCNITWTVIPEQGASGSYEFFGFITSYPNHYNRSNRFNATIDDLPPFFNNIELSGTIQNNTDADQVMLNLTVSDSIMLETLFIYDREGEITVVNDSILAPSFSAQILLNLSSGENNFTLIGTDTAGNNASYALFLTKDGISPSITSIDLQGRDIRLPIYGNTTVVSANITDNFKLSSVSYSLLRTGPYLVLNDSINRTFTSINFSINLSAGLHRLYLNISDSAGNIFFINYSFFSSQNISVTQRAEELNESIQGSEAVQIVYADGNLVQEPDNENITDKSYSITVASSGINFSFLNLSGLHVSWQQNFTASFNASQDSDILSPQNNQVLDYIRVDAEAFVFENSTYLGKVALSRNSSTLSSVFYCRYNSSSCVETLECPDMSVEADETPCYLAGKPTYIYLPHYSTIFTINDSTPPNITWQNPLNNTIISSSSNISLNITADELAYCNYSIEAATGQFSMQNTTIFSDSLFSFNPFLNANYTFISYCKDKFDNYANSSIRININDSEEPQITLSAPSPILYATASATRYNVPIDISADEYVNVSYSVNNGSQVQILWTDNRSQDVQSWVSLATGNYYINFTAADAQGNINRSSVLFSVSATVNSGDDDDDDSSGGGGGGGSSPVVSASEQENQTDADYVNESIAPSVEQPLGIITASDIHDIIILQRDTSIIISIFDTFTNRPVSDYHVAIEYPTGRIMEQSTDEQGKLAFNIDESGEFVFHFKNKTLARSFFLDQDLAGKALAVESPMQLRSNIFFPYVLMLIIIAVSASTSAYLIFRKTSRTDNELKEIIRELAKLHSKKEIEKELLKKGWKKEQIHKIFEEIK